MLLSQPPCKDCEERFINCHSQCPKWNKWKQEETQKRAKLKNFLDMERVFLKIQAERGY